MNRNSQTENLLDNSPIDLSEFDEAFNRVPATPFDDYYADLPDGTYDAEIRDAHLGRTRTAKPMLVWRMVLTSAPEIRKTVTKTRVITENTMPWLKEDLLKCGLSLSRLSELSQRVGELEGRLVRLEKKTINGKGELYFRWPERAASAAEDDAGIPF
jgi:hypothetical protein